VTVELGGPGGAARAVTAFNVREYLALRLRERVFDCCREGLASFLDGVYSVLPAEYLLMFSAFELERLLCGVPVIDLDDWRTSTAYGGAFKERGADHPVVQFFWEVVAGYSSDDQAKLLQWCTGSSKAPVRGFRYLLQRDGAVRPFTLTSVDLSQAIYPRSHACFNRIDLPLFETKADLAAAFDFVLSNDAAYELFSMD